MIPVGLPIPALFPWSLFDQQFAPRRITHSLQRVVHCHGYINAEIRAELVERSELVWGPRTAQVLTPEQLVLHMDLSVELPSRRFSFATTAPAGISGTFDAKAVEDWLAANGIDTSDPKVQKRAKDIMTAAVEIPDAQGKESHYGVKGSAWDITATPTVIRSTAIMPDWVAPSFTALWFYIWLAGVLIIRRLKKECTDNIQLIGSAYLPASPCYRGRWRCPMVLCWAH